MNRFNSSSTSHKFGDCIDTSRQVNINRLVSQNITHDSIIKNNCCETMYNPYTDYSLFCSAYTPKKLNCSCDEIEVENVHMDFICDLPHEDICEDVHECLPLENIYSDLIVIHSLDISKEREKMKNDLKKSKESQKISIKDFLKK